MVWFKLWWAYHFSFKVFFFLPELQGIGTHSGFIGWEASMWQGRKHVFWEEEKPQNGQSHRDLGWKTIAFQAGFKGPYFFLLSGVRIVDFLSSVVALKRLSSLFFLAFLYIFPSTSFWLKLFKFPRSPSKRVNLITLTNCHHCCLESCQLRGHWPAINWPLLGYMWMLGPTSCGQSGRL